jgi:hypothetical protein
LTDHVPQKFISRFPELDIIWCWIVCL